MGFDDIPFARYLTPPLTTASVPVAELGRHAWQRMWDLLNHRPAGHAIFLRPRIEIRGSAGRSGSARLCTDNPIAGYETGRPRSAPRRRSWVPMQRSTALGRVLGLRRLPEPPTVVEEGSERRDDVLIRRLRWSVGYGPDTTAWLLRRPTSGGPSGVLGLHCHGGVRSVGAEQLVDLGPSSIARRPAPGRVLLRAGSGERAGPSGPRGPGARHLLLG